MSLVRYQVVHEYDGTGYHGWQRQQGYPTIQEALETALHKFAPQASDLYVGGRTDAGVHAYGQVAHFDHPRPVLDPFRVQQAFNAHLVSHPITVRHVSLAPPGFHARFSAQQRAYHYRIINRRAPLALDRHRAWWVIPPLHINDMQEACTLLVGTRDFSTLRSTECQANSPIKTIDEAYVRLYEPHDLYFHVRARSFLHHQVRNMIGALKYVGEGRWSLDQFHQALEARDRRRGAVTAPPHGLYLDEIVYPSGT